MCEQTELSKYCHVDTFPGVKPDSYLQFYVTPSPPEASLTFFITHLLLQVLLYVCGLSTLLAPLSPDLVLFVYISSDSFLYPLLNTYLQPREGQAEENKGPPSVGVPIPLAYLFPTLQLASRMWDL